MSFSIRIKKKRQKLKSLFKGKPPDGIIPELGIKEETRDKINKRDWTRPLDRPVRKYNPDTMTTAELQKLRWSGIRYNKFTNEGEIWVSGFVRASAKADAIAKDPTVLAEMHERVFKTSGTLMEVK